MGVTMRSIDLLNFEKRDYELHENVKNAIDVAVNNLIKYKSNLPYMKNLLRNAATWKMDTWKEKYNSWKAFLDKESTCQDIKELAEVVKNCFSTCKSNEDINKIRGSIPEQYAFKIIDDTCQKLRQSESIDYKIGLGCTVIVNNKKVIIFAEDSKERIYTVDVATWNCVCGIFTEVKLAPDKFENKNIQLFLKIKAEMDKNNLKSKLIFYSWGDPWITQELLNETLGEKSKLFLTTDDIAYVYQSTQL